MGPDLEPQESSPCQVVEPVGKNLASRARLAWVQFQLYYIVYDLGQVTSPLCTHFTIWRVEVVFAPSSQGCYKD